MNRILLASILITGMAASLFAQGKPVALPPNNEETQLLRGLLHFRKIEPETPLNIRRGYDYSNLVVIVIGDPGEGRIAEICRNALSQGGAVLISSQSVSNLAGYYPSPSAVDTPSCAQASPTSFAHAFA